MRRAVLLFLLTVGPALLPASSRAQVPAEPVLRGRVLLEDSVLRRGSVVLHRVSTELQGEVDSVAVDGEGAFSFRLPSVPDPGRSEVYFASVRHAGILYFGKAITLPIQLDSLYEIHAYDTVTAPPGGMTVAVQARNVFLEPGEGGGWRVTDLFQVRNDQPRTVVAMEGGVTWRHPLPPEATDATVAEGDFASPGAEAGDGALAVTAPLPPGERLFVVRYTVPDPFLSLPVVGPTELLEVLIQEPAPALQVAGLEAAPPVEMGEGVTFRRLLGADLQDGTLDFVEAEGTREPPVRWLAVLLSMVLAGVGVWAVRQGSQVPRRAREAPRVAGRQGIILEIARLDEAFEANADPSPEERGAYEARREALLRRLTHNG